ncbi:MAG: glycosyltransferase family 2 protein [Desulfovibrio sp.]|jgi:glycosyltransferase involved in cell wall biosynthesis|nr:glycosyltransferase family 2 protein [Desulfovibrio sp.]
MRHDILPPKLSILVTHYNYNKYLSALLDNIKEQSIKDNAEVVIVDDCSDVSPEAILRQPIYKDLNIVFIQNETRLYTKNTRLKAIEAATSELVTFVDADDRFFGTSVLEMLVNVMIHEDADLLHFNLMHRNRNSCEGTVTGSWHSPFAERLKGDEVFNAYVENSCRAHTVYGKIFKRSLWMKCMEIAKRSKVLRYQEDFFLMSLLFYHSQNYFGSEMIGYLQNTDPSRGNEAHVKAHGRLATSYHMLSELIPYFVANGADESLIEKFKNSVINSLKINFLALLDGTIQSENLSHCEYGVAVNKILDKMSEYTDKETFLRILLTHIKSC